LWGRNLIFCKKFPKNQIIFKETGRLPGPKGPERLRLLGTYKELASGIFTSLTMPKMNGIELAEAALQRRPDIPVILTTGFSETGILDRAKELGIRRCLMKPLVLRQLGWAVRRELDRKD